VARFLVGNAPGRKCRIEAPEVERKSLVEVLTPLRKSAYPPAGYTGSRVMEDVARIVEGNRSTIIFTNTRSSTEGVSLRLKRSLPHCTHLIEAHHSSLDRDLRLEVEDRLKDGELKAVVCSTSLELGIDVGSIDTVVMMSTPKGISRALQRIGRSGHSIRQMSHGVLVATNINDLIECVVCAEMVKVKKLDPVRPMENALDVVIQHIVGLAMEGGVTPDEAFAIIRRAHGFRTLERKEFDQILRYLEGGGESLEAQYRDTFGKIELRDGFLATLGKKVERDYLVNIGTIAADGTVAVMLGRRRLGEVEERFAKNLKLGDTFVISGRVVRLVESGVGEVKVEEGRGLLPSIPSWNANKMPLASGLAREVTRFRTEMWERMQKDEEGAVLDWLVEDWSVSLHNAEAIHEHFRSQMRFSTIPREGVFLVESFRDEEEDPDRVHFFFHSLIGRSANDALSRILSWRLQEAVGGNAMVTIDDYGFLLSLKAFQSLEGAEWKELFRPANARADLERALEGSELVKWQFSGVAQTGLMVPRNLPGKERKLKQLRWSAEILFRVLTEQEPNHPLIRQSYREAMHTFLDTDRAISFLEAAEEFVWEFREVPVVTPFSFGIYVSRIKEGMMMEDPDQAIERLFSEMHQRFSSANPQ
ncbi:MAG: helicase-related protein, partial [Verrucomicrobiota bacterium]